MADTPAIDDPAPARSRPDGKWKYASNALLSRVLECANERDLEPLFEHTGTHHAFRSILANAISRKGGHAILNIFRQDHHEEFVGYLEILIDVVEALDPQWAKENLTKSLKDKWIQGDKFVAAEKHLAALDELLEFFEALVLHSIAKRLWAKMTPAQKASFQETLDQVSAQYNHAPYRDVIGAGGVLLVANMGGFTTYMVLSSILHTVSMGLLGFGAYTAASSALALALGPVGWTALAGYAAFRIGSPKMQKLVPIVATVALIRRRYAERLL